MYLMYGEISALPRNPNRLERIGLAARQTSDRGLFAETLMWSADAMDTSSGRLLRRPHLSVSVVRVKIDDVFLIDPKAQCRKVLALVVWHLPPALIRRRRVRRIFVEARSDLECTLMGQIANTHHVAGVFLL